MPLKNPPHPGDFIRTEIVEAARLTVTAAAKALRVSRPTLSSLLNGNADLSGCLQAACVRPLYRYVFPATASRYRSLPRGLRLILSRGRLIPSRCRSIH